MLQVFSALNHFLRSINVDSEDVELRLYLKTPEAACRVDQALIAEIAPVLTYRENPMPMRAGRCCSIPFRIFGPDYGQTERRLGPTVIKGKLFFKLFDGSAITCECIGEPYASEIVELWNARAK